MKGTPVADFAVQTLSLRADASSADLLSALGVAEPRLVLLVARAGHLTDHPLRIEVSGEDNVLDPTETRAALRQDPTYVCIDAVLAVRSGIALFMEQARNTGHVLVVISFLPTPSDHVHFATPA